MRKPRLDVFGAGWKPPHGVSDLASLLEPYRRLLADPAIKELLDSSKSAAKALSSHQDYLTAIPGWSNQTSVAEALGLAGTAKAQVVLEEFASTSLGWPFSESSRKAMASMVSATSVVPLSEASRSIARAVGFYDYSAMAKTAKALGVGADVTALFGELAHLKTFEVFGRTTAADPAWAVLGTSLASFQQTYLSVEQEHSIPAWRRAFDGFATLTLARELASSPELAQRPSRERLHYAEVRRERGEADSTDLEQLIRERLPEIMDSFHAAQNMAIGPDHRRHLAASCRAMIEALLKRFAPEKAVREWLASQGKSPDVRGASLRKAQVAYALRERGERVTQYVMRCRHDVVALYSEASRLIHFDSRGETVNVHELFWKTKTWLRLVVRAHYGLDDEEPGVH